MWHATKSSQIVWYASGLVVVMSLIGGARSAMSQVTGEESSESSAERTTTKGGI
jgi:hypothetical protein